jgi:hypothetical protein
MANRQSTVRPYVAQTRRAPTARSIRPQAVPAKVQPKSPVVRPAPQGPIAKSAPRTNTANIARKAARQTVVPVRSTEKSRVASLNRDWAPTSDK